MERAPRAWRCTVCGYVHRGPEPPDPCPLCGATRDAFEPYEAPPARVAPQPTSRWQCLNCSYVHLGPEPPETCQVCGAHADRFQPHGEELEPSPAAGQGSRVVVVGGGVAGVSAAEAVKRGAPDAVVTLLSKEGELPLYRLNLTRYLAGEVGEEALVLHPRSWYDELGIDLLPGSEVGAIDLASHRVELLSGGSHEFDRLILAAGSHPIVPPFSGTTREGVHTFRTLEDATRILEAVRGGARCVVIGGGVLGLETAGAMARRGAEVTVLEGFGWLLPRQLNERAGRLLESFVASSGIGVRVPARVKELVGDERVRGVLLEDGTTIPADLVVISTGIRPNSYLARLAGLQVGQGVVVDDRLRASHPEVFAAGDVAEHRGVVAGLWVPAMYQGNIAGMNAAGLEAEFGGIPRSNTLKVLDFDMYSIGLVEPEDASYEVLEEERGGGYARFVFRDCRMVGAILVGDTSLSAAAKKAVEDGADFSAAVGTRKCAGVLDTLRGAA